MTRVGGANVVIMIDNGVTNLRDKSLSKLIRYFLDIVTKNAIIFNKHALLSKEIVNTRTWIL